MNTEQHIKNLRTIQAHIATLPQDQIVMHEIGYDSEQDTWVGPRCVLAHALTIPELDKSDIDNFPQYAEEIFGIDEYDEFVRLFGNRANNDKDFIHGALEHHIIQKELSL